MSATVLAGDCRTLMAEMEGCSIDSIVTDAPYELGFMGRDWDSTGVAYDVATWRAAWAVLKPGGWLVCFGGSRTCHRMACAIEDAGFDIRDQIMWIYGSGFPKGGNRDGKGTCLKPAHEPIVLARKPLIGSVARNETAFGTGALNIDACRVGADLRVNGAASPSSMHRTSRVEAGYRHDDGVGPGAPARAVVGRWPANVIHDGSDEVLAAFPEAPGQLSTGRDDARSQGLVYGAISKNGGRVHEPRGDSGSAARFFYCAKASKADRDEGLDAFAPQHFVQFQTGNGESGAASSLSAGRETQYRNTHPTVKPTALMRWLVRLVTPGGGTVLDPFTGSGSTGKAAVLEGRDFIGCELTEAYLPIARARIAAAQAMMATLEATPVPQPDLFTTEAA